MRRILCCPLCQSAAATHVCALAFMPSMDNAAPSAAETAVPMEEDSGSLWTGYQFTSKDKEEKYLKRFEMPLVRAFQMWGTSRFLFDVLLPCSFITQMQTLDFYIAYLPNILITVVSCFVVTFLPRCSCLPRTQRCIRK